MYCKIGHKTDSNKASEYIYEYIYKTPYYWSIILIWTLIAKSIKHLRSIYVPTLTSVDTNRWQIDNITANISRERCNFVRVTDFCEHYKPLCTCRNATW